MECTFEIVEEVTVLRVTKVSAAEVPLTARGRSSGSKTRKMGEKIGEDKSEQVIRIEDIEAESPSKDQVSAQQKTELHVSELEKTEGMSSVEDMVDTAPDDAAKMLDQPDTILAQQDLEEADVTQVEDDAPQNHNSISCDSQITVENVVSEIEEECHEEDTAALAVSEEASEEAETLDKVGEGIQVGVTDEKSEETITQQEPSLSTHATSENGEAGKTGRANVEDVTTVQSTTPRRRYTRHSKQEDRGIILRGRTLINTPPPTRKYTRRSQKVSEESEKVVDEVDEEKGVSEEEEETSIEEDVVTMEETEQLEDEQLKNEEEPEKQQEPGVEDAKLPDAAETAVAKKNEDEMVTDESENETSVIQNKTDAPENEIEEPPAEASAGEENADEQAAHKQVEEHQQVANDAVTVTVTMEEKQCAVSEICADRDADIPGGDGAEGKLPLAEVDESMTLEEEEAPVVETRALRSKTKTSTASPRRKSTRSRKQMDAQEAENSEEDPAVTLRRGMISTTDAPEGKSRRSRKQIQEETQEGEEESKCVEETGVVEEDAAKEAAIEKTDEEMEEIVDTVKETASEKEEDVAEQKQDTVEVITELGSDPPTEVDERKAPEEDEIEAENEKLVTAEVEEEDTAGVTAAADDLVQEETDAPLPSPPTGSAVLLAVEKEATPSAEAQQSEDMATPLSDLRRVTVVLVDLQKTHHDVQEEAAATEEGLPAQKTAAEAEVEAAETQDPGEERDEETAKEEEAKSVNVEEQTHIVPETRTPKSGKQAVEATPRTRGRPRKGQVRKEAAPDIQTEEPAVQVRVLRTGRKSLPITQRSTTKRTRKQLQEEEEEEGGEESTAVEAREEEEEQQMTDQEKEERLEERDTTEPVENIEAEVASEKEDTVAEETVHQHNAREEGQVDSTETVADEDAEASVEHHDHEEKTFVVAEKAVAKQDTAEGEQSTSTSGVEETMLTAKDEQANDASEEEAPVVGRVLRSGEKKTRATTRSRTTKKSDDEQEEEAPGEKSTEEDEPAVEIRVLRKGRKPTEAAPRRQSKRARTQCQTEEGGEEATPTEEIEGEEEEAGQDSPEEKGVEEMEKEEEAHNAAGEESTVGDAEPTKDASTAEAGVLEEEDSSVEVVDGTHTDTVLPSLVEVEETNSAVEDETAVVEQPAAAAEVGSDSAVAEEEALVEEASVVAEEDAAAATTRAFRSRQKASPATPSPRSRRQKDDSPRRSVRKRPKVDYRENNEGERDETEGNSDEEKEVPVASDEDQGDRKSECSSNAEEVGEAAGSSLEDEEYEQNTSEEEEEPIVIGNRVLRGRLVPSVIITPQSKSRRRSAKVSNKDKSPRSARKRKSTEGTRKSKRLSRV